ncbi:hypothetical protein WR25_25102 [Diploscapter pachys]|uniref:Uncharacterized protein n=1 Tax=Diploscapter pachys TaxID=2018661 RepID=A0A2A2K577_9BILA|nr:hypothetical protein WR25_25102 [Diploscapter pachys]
MVIWVCCAPKCIAVIILLILLLAFLGRDLPVVVMRHSSQLLVCFCCISRVVTVIPRDSAPLLPYLDISPRIHILFASSLPSPRTPTLYSPNLLPNSVKCCRGQRTTSHDLLTRKAEMQ